MKIKLGCFIYSCYFFLWVKEKLFCFKVKKIPFCDLSPFISLSFALFSFQKTNYFGGQLFSLIEIHPNFFLGSSFFSLYLDCFCIKVDSISKKVQIQSNLNLILFSHHSVEVKWLLYFLSKEYEKEFLFE